MSIDKQCNEKWAQLYNMLQKNLFIIFDHLF